jgi:tetratricopeptide (TPR) repeat protein
VELFKQDDLSSGLKRILMERVKYRVWWFIFLGSLLFCFLTPLVQAKTHLERANEYAVKSEEFFNEAVSEYYLALDEPGADIHQIQFLLGKLYYEHGRFEKSREILSSLYSQKKDDFLVAKLLALSYYKTGNYTRALVIFDKNENSTDQEFLYYYGQTCEKKSLFDKAVRAYSQIKEGKYLSLAEKRILLIDAGTKLATVDDIEDPYLKNLIKTSPDSAEYPNAGAIVLLDDEWLEILSDGTAVQTTHFMVKILNERGKHYGEVELDYDSTYETIEIEYARTIEPEGKVVSVGDKHIRDVSRYLEYPLYSNARVRIVSMPEVTWGAIIEYKMKKYINKLVNGENFSFQYGIQGYEPCLNRKLKMSVPSAYKLHIKSYNPGFISFPADLSPRVRALTDRTEYELRFSNIPEIIEEPSMPPWVEVVPSLSFSSFDSWQMIGDWWEDLADHKMELDEVIKAKVEDLIQDKETTEEKAASIYHWVAEKIRYIAVEYGEAGFEPHEVSEVFKNKYGDCKDQTVLLISMLRYAGISAYPVLISTRGNWRLDDNFPALFFDHAMVLAKIGEAPVFLDPTGETVSFGDLPRSDQNRKALILAEGKAEIETIPLFSADHNKFILKMNLRINEDETIWGTRQIFTFGEYDQGQRWWIKYTKPALIKEQLKSVINNFSPGGEMLDYHISKMEELGQPIEITVEFKGPKFLTSLGEERLIPVLGGVSADFVSRRKRNYPLDFGVLRESRTLIQIKLPDSLTVKYLPPPIIKDTQWFTYINKYTFSNSCIFFEELMSDKVTRISVDEYIQYKAAYEELARQTDKQVVLSKVTP